MSKDELLKLADRLQKKADTAAENYQETGISRYGSTARRNEDLAEALRMAAGAANEHQEYIAMKGQMSNFAWRARMASCALPTKTDTKFREKAERSSTFRPAV